MNTLLIHIGSPKTGTTALQNFLYDNADKLEDHNWRYPDTKTELFEISSLKAKKQINGAIFFKELTEENGRTAWERHTVDVDSERWNQVWCRILEHLKEKNVIISSEVLFRDSITNLFLEGAKRKYDNIKVVVYLRRQDKFVESLWNQIIKEGISCENSFIEYAYSDRIRKLTCYAKKLDEISAIVGKENLIVRIYEKEQFKNASSIAKDFLSLIGIDSNCKELKECKRHNPKLSPNYLEIKNQVNSVIDWREKVNRNYYNKSFLDLSDRFIENGKEKGFFTMEERKRYIGLFASENERIAREYLHREDGMLFYVQDMNISKYKPHELTSYDRDIIHVFTFLVEKIRKQNWILAENLLRMQKTERKLAFFGAGQRAEWFFDVSELRPNIIIDNNLDKRHRQMQGIEILVQRILSNWQFDLPIFLIALFPKPRRSHRYACVWEASLSEKYSASNYPKLNFRCTRDRGY